MSNAASPVPLGIVGGGPAAWVDDAQVLSSGGMDLEWWIGAADRWHRPSGEVTLRRSRLGVAPAVQYSLRIPGGDARVQLYAAVADGAEWIVMDVLNDSPSPMALAVATGTTDRRVLRWRLTQASALADGVLVSVAARPADAWCAAASIAELWAAVSATGQDRDELSELRVSDRTIAQVALAQVFAVAHRTGMRLLVAAASATGAPSRQVGFVPAAAQPNAVVSADAVVRGWRRQLGSAASAELGDEGIDDEILARRADLLVDDRAVGPATISALAAWGHSSEATQRLRGVLGALVPPVDAEQAAQLIVAMADVALWSPDPEGLAAALAPTAIELSAWLPRRGRARDAAQWALDRLIDLAGGTGARRKRAGSGTGEAHRGSREGPAPELGRAAEELLRRRADLVCDDVDGLLRLLDGWQDSWRGRSIDVDRLPTVYGPLSFALRWHGQRPALLWHLGPAHTRTMDPFELRCPRLDPAFHSGDMQGETLLAAPRAG